MHWQWKMSKDSSQPTRKSLFYAIYEANKAMETKPLQKASHLIELNSSARPAIVALSMHQNQLNQKEARSAFKS